MYNLNHASGYLFNSDYSEPTILNQHHNIPIKMCVVYGTGESCAQISEKCHQLVTATGELWEE